MTGSAKSSAGGRRSISPTSSSSTRGGRRSPSRRGNGLTIDEWLSYAESGEPVHLHVRQAEDGEAAAFRRDPEGRRRVPPAAARLSGAGRGGAAGQPGLAHPPRPAAGQRHGGELRHAPEPGQRRPMPRTRRRSGGSSAAMPRRRAPETHPHLDAAAGHAVRYFEDFVRPGQDLPAGGARRGGGARRPARPAGGAGRGRRRPRGCRTWSSRSATRMASIRSGPGSRRSTRCCSGRSRGRASAASSRSTACPRRWR